MWIHVAVWSPITSGKGTQFFCFGLIVAILWLLTRNAGIVQFCQKIQFQSKGDFKWFRTGSLDIWGTFRSRPEPWLGGRARLQRRWQRWTRLLSELGPANKALDEDITIGQWWEVLRSFLHLCGVSEREAAELGKNKVSKTRESLRPLLMRPYFSLLRRSRSSWRLSGLHAIANPLGDTADGGEDGFWKGVDVKQVFGLEWGRSALTGVGFILLDGLDALNGKKQKNKRDIMYFLNIKDEVRILFF